MRGAGTVMYIYLIFNDSPCVIMGCDKANMFKIVITSQSMETGPSAQIAHTKQQAPSTLVPANCKPIQTRTGSTAEYENHKVLEIQHCVRERATLSDSLDGED